MKTTGRKFLAVLLVSLMLIATFTGCVSQYATESTEPQNTTQSTNQGNEGSEGNSGPITLDVWYAISGASGEKFIAQSEAFAAENENIDLALSYSGSAGDTATKVGAAMLNNTPPDVALMYAGPLYTGGHGNFTIAEMMERPEFNLDDVYPGVLDYCTYLNEGICAVPYGISTQVMYYNKDILAQAGIDMTNPPKTWSEFLEVCKALKEKNADTSDFVAFDTSDEAWLFKSMLMQNGCTILEDLDTTGGEVIPNFNNAQGVEVAEFWKELVDSGVMIPGEHSNAENKFLAGTVGFIAASSNRVSRWSGNTEFELGAIEMPYFTQPSVALGGNVLVILTQDPERVEAAWEYICYLTETEQITDFALSTGYLPIRKSSTETPAAQQALSENEMYGVAFKQLEYSWSYTHFDQMGTMDNELRSMLNRLELNQGTPQELLDDAYEIMLDEINQ